MTTVPQPQRFHDLDIEPVDDGFDRFVSISTRDAVTDALVEIAICEDAIRLQRANANGGRAIDPATVLHFVEEAKC